jgi:hypothetical protein
MVVIDATILMLFLRPDAGAPVGIDDAPIEKPKERIEYLISQLTKARERIIIPAPVLSEVLVRALPGDAQRLVEQMSSHAIFRIEPFDALAAIELAIMTRNAIDGGLNPKRRNAQATYAKLKFDRQVVAIAKVVRATTIYSDDGDIYRIAKRENIKVVGLNDMTLPDEAAQFTMQLEAPDQGRDEEDPPRADSEERDGQEAV